MIGARATKPDAGNYNFTLTRLHARYGKDVKNDLVFRSVESDRAAAAAFPTSTARDLDEVLTARQHPATSRPLRDHAPVDRRDRRAQRRSAAYGAAR